MSNTKLSCCKCGKEFELTERIYTCGDLWQCEDCAIKQMQENDDKDKTISDLEAKLAESEKKNFELIAKLNLKEHRPAFCTLADRECEALGKVEQLKQQLAEKEKLLEINEKILRGTKLVKREIERKKIEFAIAELKQARDLIFDLDIGDHYFKTYFSFSDIKVNRDEVFNIIDSQIEQLKEMK